MPLLHSTIAQHFLLVALLSVLVAAICRVFRPAPAIRHALWLVVLIKLAVLPVFWSVSVPVEIQASSATDELEQSAGTQRVGFSEPRHADGRSNAEWLAALEQHAVGNSLMARETPPSSAGFESAPAIDDSTDITHWSNANSENAARDQRSKWNANSWLAASIGWLAGSVIMLVRYLILAFRVHRVIRRGQAPPDSFRQVVKNLSRQLSVRTPRVVEVEAAGPFVWCLGSTHLVWPSRLLKSAMDETVQRSLIVHELAHVRRRDHWVAWLEMAATICWWWNPLTWIVRSRVRENAELACDAFVLREVQSDPRAYAETLIQLAGPATSRVLSVPAVGIHSGARRAFERRLEMIMSGSVPKSRRISGVLSLCLLTVLLLPGFAGEKNEAPPAEENSGGGEPASVDDNGQQEASVGETVSREAARALSAQRFDRAAKAVVTVRAKLKAGNDANEPVVRTLMGVVIDKAGLVLTQHRITANAESFEVQIGQKACAANLVYEDAARLIAVLKLTDPPSDLTALPAVDPSNVKVGSIAVTLDPPKPGRNDPTKPTADLDWLADPRVVTGTERSIFIKGVMVDGLVQTDFDGDGDHDILFTNNGGQLLGLAVDPNLVGADGIRIVYPAAKVKEEIAQRAKLRMKVLNEIVDRIEKEYVNELNRDELLQAAIDGVLKKLDSQSAYLTQDQLDDFHVQSGDGAGVGIRVNFDANKRDLLILETLPGTPARRAGLGKGDRIVSVEGHLVMDFRRGKELKRAIALMRGAEGTPLTLGLVREGQQEVQHVRLVRAKLQIPTLFGWTPKGDGGWNYFVDEEAKLGYVHIRAFTKPIPVQLDAIIHNLREAGMKGFVLDLRGCPGGLLTSGVGVADLFLEEGRILRIVERGGEHADYDAREKGTWADFPIAVLVDPLTASAAEIVTAALQDHGRAVVIGEQTFGRGTIQSLLPLGDGAGALKLTTAHYERPRGGSLQRPANAQEGQRWGVQPDEGYEVKVTRDERRMILTERRQREAGDDFPQGENSKDTQLRTALEWLREKVS